ncbi:MAG: hypothetical protein AMK69_24060 [Nitrospira bacterium SG8_3]|nr:MAG: hypothetical protein AMK69_24060 [Nitrospira bacterium SG8_3]
MKKKTPIKWLLVTTVFLFLGCMVVSPAISVALTRTHVVVRGDTLWDLCEKYYGDPDLWPKLWEMNPFVTNPHLLKPGDTITLLEGVPFKESFEQDDSTRADQEGRKTPGPGDEDLAEKDVKKQEGMFGMPWSALKGGIDVGSYMNVNTFGYLSRTKVEPEGRIFSSETKKEMLYEGDTAFVVFDGDVDVKPGDQFTVAKSTKLVPLPNTGRRRGYVISFVGQIMIEGPAALNRRGEPDERKNIYQATITESYRAVNVDDLVLPYEPISSCIEPTPVEEKFITTVHAGKDDTKILGELSVVYFDRGHKHGIREGQLFELVRSNIVPKPSMGAKTYTDDKPRILPRRKVTLPELSIGVILIVDARKYTSTGLVISANEEFHPGVSVKAGFTQIEPTGYLSMVPSCNGK